MRLSTCPCFTLRRAPAQAATPGAAWLMRAGYWLPQGGETPLGAALRYRVRDHVAQALALPPDAWVAAPPDAARAPWWPAAGPGNPRLEAVLAWGRAFLTSPRRVPITLAWAWRAAAGPIWGVYRWTWEPVAEPRVPLWVPSAREVPLGPGWSGARWHLPATAAAEDAALPPPPVPRGPAPPSVPPPQPVATPNAASVDAVAAQLGIPPAAVLKTLFWMARLPGPRGWTERLVAALLPGDRRLDPWRLAAALQAWHVRPATEDEVRAVGAVPGFASPVGLEARAVTVVLDADAADRGPWVMGANRTGYHLRGVWPTQHFAVDRVARLAAAPASATPPMAWAGQVPPAWVQAAGVRVDTPQGRRTPHLAWWEADARAWLAALAAAHADEQGLAWPPDLAPFGVHLVRLRPRRAAAAAALDAWADEVAARLRRAGWRVLDDDRDLSPGVKFTDADLMGAPWRVVVSARGLEARQVEVKARTARQARWVTLDALVSSLRGEAV